MLNPLKIVNIVGARPNLVKIAPLMREMCKHAIIQPVLLHTGQHYDEKLSDVFFRQMGIPTPDFNLEVGSGSHAWQTAEILKRTEPLLLDQKPDLVLVVGDVNSTIAASLASVKLGIPVAHVEAGLRGLQSEQSLDQHTRSSQQYKRSGNLCDRKYAQTPVRPTSDAYSSAIEVDSLRGVGGG